MAMPPWDSSNNTRRNIMTPCEEKGYKVGEVFKVIGVGNAVIDKNDIVVLREDDHSSAPLFTIIDGRSKGDYGCLSLFKVERIWPPEEKKVETIELMGKTYNKEEIEKALSNVKPMESLE